MSSKKENQRLTGNVALTRLQHVILEKKGKTGIVRGIFIPIELNKLEEVEYETKEGKVKEINIPVNIIIKPETDERGQDGFIAKAIPSAVYKKATDEEKEGFKKITPVLGNLKDWSRVSGGSSAPVVNDAGSGEVFADDDDLPF
jgi:hypothetical protein